MSILILVVSSALLFFYVQICCEKVLRQEFSRAFFKDIIQAVRLEYPQLRDSVATDGALHYGEMRHALQCDFFAMKSLLKCGDPSRRHRTHGERLLGLYFRFLLFSLPIRHALNLKEREAVLRLASILHFFANSIGEKLSVDSLAVAQARLNS